MQRTLLVLEGESNGASAGADVDEGFETPFIIGADVDRFCSSSFCFDNSNDDTEEANESGFPTR